MPAQVHPVFRPPADTAVKIWRYMSLAKFIWTLQKRALYFARSDLMGDPFEGHYSKITAMSEDAFVRAQMSDPVFSKFGEDVHRRNFQQILSTVPKEKLLLFVNCWHMNEYESLAMWKLYAAQHDSICIQSTYSKFERLLPHDCFLGTVRYIDYNKEYIDMTNGLQFIVHKRRSFEHERELRSVLWSPAVTTPFKSDDGRGLIVPIDVNDLIDGIYINPNAKPILEDVVNGLKHNYALAAPVHKSDVNEAPNY